MSSDTGLQRFARPLPGLGLALLALVSMTALNAIGHTPVPTLTLCIILGVILGNVPGPSRLAAHGTVTPGLKLAAKSGMRLAVVLLGLKLTLQTIAGLNPWLIAALIAIVSATFGVTLLLGRIARMPGDEPVLLAAGFSICGVSAIGGMAAARGSDARDQATPAALVTLCGSLAIALVPLTAHLIGLTPEQAGVWTGMSVHDVGQVVAIAQGIPAFIGGGAEVVALAIAVKLTRVLMLAPIVTIAGMHRRHTESTTTEAKRPALVPLFVLGFIAAVLLRSFVPLPPAALEIAGVVQDVLLGMALFALGTQIRIVHLITKGWRGLIAALGAWLFIALAALAAARLLA